MSIRFRDIYFLDLCIFSFQSLHHASEIKSIYTTSKLLEIMHARVSFEGLLLTQAKKLINMMILSKTTENWGCLHLVLIFLSEKFLKFKIVKFGTLKRFCLNFFSNMFSLKEDRELLDFTTVWSRSLDQIYIVTCCITSFLRHTVLSVYWVPQKLPQIYTVIAYICIWKVAWFAVYICGNIWNALYPVF